MVKDSQISNVEANVKSVYTVSGAEQNAEFNIGLIGTLSNNNAFAVTNSKITGSIEIAANKAKTLNVGGLAANILSTGTEYTKINGVHSDVKLKITATDIQNAYVGGLGGQVQDIIENI